MSDFFSPWPVAPNTIYRADTIDEDSDAFFGHFESFTEELEDYVESLAGAAAPAGVLLLLAFDGSSTADADPGAGKFRFGSSPQNAAVVLRISTTDALGVDISADLASLAASGSVKKGILRIQGAADRAKRLTFDVLGVTGAGAYRNVAVAVRGYSSTNPFVDGDTTVGTFADKGDQGAVGPNGPWTNVLSPVTISGSPTVVTFTNLPTGYADIRFPYVLTFTGVAQMGVQLSSDGVTWSSLVIIEANNPTSRSANLILFDYLSDRPGLSTQYGPNVLGASPAASVGVDGLSGLANVTGGIRAIRFTSSAAVAIQSGNFHQPRAR